MTVKTITRKIDIATLNFQVNNKTFSWERPNAAITKRVKGSKMADRLVWCVINNSSAHWKSSHIQQGRVHLSF